MLERLFKVLSSKDALFKVILRANRCIELSQCGFRCISGRSSCADYSDI